MRYEPTPALEIAMRRAGAFARRAESASLGAEHLLLGLLAEDEGKPVAFLLQAGVDAERLRRRFPKLDPEPNESEEETPITRDVREILSASRELAAFHSDEGTISTDQVLLALLEHQEPLREEFVALGLDLERLRPLIATEARILVVDEPPEWTDEVADAEPVVRLLDASANRAREALRVLEDYVRFLKNDPYLSRELKQLRHDFVQAMELLPSARLLGARDTEADVGTRIGTEREYARENVADVVRANWARLQEAFRSLEEFGKILNADFARIVEKLRYQAYTLEKAMAHGPDALERLASASLYFLATEHSCRASLVGTVREAIEGGAGIVQLREKNDDDRTLLAKARDLRELTRRFGAIFLVNDRPDIAKLAEADGVHVGQDDLPIRACRRILGPGAIVGVSTHDLAQVRQAIRDGADYLGVGPMFPSATKSFTEFPGVDFLREALRETSLPIFALGGITLDNLPILREAGCERVAISQALSAADDPKKTAGEFVARLVNR